MGSLGSLARVSRFATHVLPSFHSRRRRLRSEDTTDEGKRGASEGASRLSSLRSSRYAPALACGSDRSAGYGEGMVSDKNLPRPSEIMTAASCQLLPAHSLHSSHPLRFSFHSPPEGFA